METAELETPSGTDEQEAVSVNPITGDIIIRFGQLEPIEIPPDIAVKFATLLLKKSGALVKINPDSIIIKLRKAHNRGH